MKLLKLTASFGGLQKRELTLSNGLNVFCLPNEAGKSTWSMFLLCMFYGVDTSERPAKGVLPVKTRFKPWWGGSMEGRMELEWQGRRIAIERTSTARAPLGQFRAWDLDSGEKIPELTADNCGETLLGVPRSVYLRSAFLGQNALAVTQDAALEKRLSSLVTSGDESVSAAETQKRLKDARNRIRHNKTGLLPDAQRELETVNDTLSQLHALLSQTAEGRAKEQQLFARQRELEADISCFARFQTAQRFLKKRKQEQLVEDKTRAAEQALQNAKQYPEKSRLTALSKDLDTLESKRTLLPQTPKAPPLPPEKPVCPPVFANLSDEEILPKAERDAKRCEALMQEKKASAALAFAIGFCFLVAAILLFALAKNLLPAMLAAALAIAGLGAGIWNVRKNRLREEKLHEAKLLCAQYENREPSQFVSFAANYHASALLFRQAQTAYETALQEYRTARQDAETARGAYLELRGRLLGGVNAFAPDVTEEEAAREAIDHALSAWAQADAAQDEASHARAALEAICQALSNEKEPEVPAGDWAQFDLPAAKQELALTVSQLSRLRSELDRSRGVLQTLGDGSALQAQKAALESRISELQERDEALSMAQAALEEASSALQTRFAPRLTARAAEIFAGLTGGRYEQMTLDRQMNLWATETGEVAQRPVLALSGGTADQLYLALRLAIVELALPDDAPIVLDDALAMFDDERAEKALQVLKKLSGTRQILLFSCHSREAQMLESL